MIYRTKLFCTEVIAESYFAQHRFWEWTSLSIHQGQVQTFQSLHDKGGQLSVHDADLLSHVEDAFLSTAARVILVIDAQSVWPSWTQSRIGMFQSELSHSTARREKPFLIVASGDALAEDDLAYVRAFLMGDEPAMEKWETSNKSPRTLWERLDEESTTPL